MNKQEIDKYVKKNVGLVVVIAKKYANKTIPLHDLIQYGYQGLYKYLPNYDKQKSSLKTYAIKYIKYGILQGIKEISNKELFIEEKILNLNPGETQQEVYDEIETNDTATRIINEINKMSNKKHQKVIKMLFGIKPEQELSNQEICQKLNLKQNDVSMIKNRFVNKMKNKYS